VGHRGGFLPKLLLTILAMVACFCAPASADKRVALVIGNSTYQSVTRLDNPKNDAKLMADTLRGLGFTLVGGAAQIDLDKAKFDGAVQSFGNQLPGADVALFYYAGHGVQVRGSNYLVPVGANPTKEADVDFQMVDVALVLRQMEGSGTKLNLVILDACRNNPFGGRGLRAADGGLAQMRAPEGTLISYATQPGNVAQDGTDGDSPYTKALAATLRRPGLDIFQTFNEVGLAVMQATGNVQQPWVSTSPIKGSFHFVSAAAQVPAAPAQVLAAPAPAVGTSEAAQTWATIQSTTSIAVLQTFVDRFGDTFYGNMARARLEELKKHQAVAAIPPPAAQKRVAATSQTDMARTFEPNINREGTTIAELNLSSADARLCQNLCIKDTRCTAWVYRAPEGRSDGRPHCWLRTNSSRSRGDNLTISGDVRR
jgi:uncharacterized caspase-like protein